MKKKVTFVSLVLFVLVCMTGCMRLENTDTVSRNGVCTSSMNMAVEKQAMMNYMNKIIAEAGGEAYTSETLDSYMFSEGYMIQVIDGLEYYINPKEEEKEVSSLAKMYKKNQVFSVKGTCQYWETGFYQSGEVLEESLGKMGDQKKDLLKGNDAAAAKEMLNLWNNSYFIYTIEFDYDIVKTDSNAVIDPTNPKRATWKLKMSQINSKLKMYAYCNSSIKVSGVTQGSTYKKPVKLRFAGVTQAIYRGKKLANNATFKKHGQHNVVLKAANGEQRTVCFFIDTKKPVVKGIKNGKTYKAKKTFKITDKDSGVASVKINGKTVKAGLNGSYATKKGTNRIVVKDNAGNVTKIKVKIKK